MDAPVGRELRNRLIALLDQVDVAREDAYSSSDVLEELVSRLEELTGRQEPMSSEWYRYLKD